MSGLKNPIGQPILDTSFVWFLLISQEWAKQYIYFSCFMYLFRHIKISFLQTKAKPTSETSCFVRKLDDGQSPPPPQKKIKTGSACIA